MTRIKIITLACLVVMTGWVVSAQAAAPFKELEAVKLIGRIQATLIYFMSDFDAQTIMGRTMTGWEEPYAQYKADLKKLAQLTGVGRAGREKITKYYNMVLARDAEINEQLDRFEADLKKTGRPDSKISAQLALTAGRYRYAMDQMIRHLTSDLNIERLKQDQLTEYGETFHLIILQQLFLTAVFEAYDGNYPGASKPAHGFWLMLGRFDYQFQMYKIFIRLSGLTEARSAFTANLEKIKHDLVVKGEAMYIESARDNRPDPKTVNEVWKLNQKAYKMFQDKLN